MIKKGVKKPLVNAEVKVRALTFVCIMDYAFHWDGRTSGHSGARIGRPTRPSILSVNNGAQHFLGMPWQLLPTGNGRTVQPWHIWMLWHKSVVG